MTEEEQAYQEFCKWLRRGGPKVYKITGCLGARAAWKWVRKNKWVLTDGPVDQLLYSQVIREIHKLLVDRLMEGHEIIFPNGMGSLRLTSLPGRVTVDKDGNIQTNYRNDWAKTIRYWFEDNSAMKKGKMVKMISKDIYFVRYYKDRANYLNKRFYSFRPNISLIKRLGYTLRDERVNAMQFDFNV